jgi:hypothetical protein
MTHQYSIAVRDARNEAIETIIGASAKLYLYSGAKPAACVDSDPSGLLVTLTLPTDWIGVSANGIKAKGAIVWTGTCSNPGVAASFRIKDNGASACHIQGTVGQGSGDLSLDNTNISVGQTITISTFQITAGNA